MAFQFWLEDAEMLRGNPSWNSAHCFDAACAGGAGDQGLEGERERAGARKGGARHPQRAGKAHQSQGAALYLAALYSAAKLDDNC